MTYRLDHVKVLIVDDMRPMLEICKMILETFGFTNILTADSGEKAFQIFCKENPDFIITDWHMEPMNGLELTRKIRSDPMSPNRFVPVIMMSGFSSRLRVEDARDCGITEFLVKPFKAQDVYSRVFQVIEKPRQFVSTEVFFGPDRRRKIIGDYKGPRRRDVDPDHPMRNNEDKELLKQLSRETKNI